MYSGPVEEDSSSVPDPVPQISRDQIRVLIVDDEPSVRSGLRYALLAFDDLDPVGEAASAEEALIMCGHVLPDIVLMDLMVPGMDAATAIRAVRRRWPQTHVIALTSFAAEDLAQGALEAGAAGYLLKNVSAKELADAIRAAHADKALPDADRQKPLQKKPCQPC